MRHLLGFVALIALAATARAEAIDDFTFVTSAHTLTFALPALIPNYYPPGYPPPGPHVGIDNYDPDAAGSIDGVGGYLFNLDFTTSASPIRSGFLLTSGTGNAVPNYNVLGPDLVSGPLTDFPLGTFSYNDAPSYRFPDPGQLFEGPYTLTITQQITATPEPGTITFLLLGSLACLPPVRRQLASHHP